MNFVIKFVRGLVLLGALFASTAPGWAQYGRTYVSNTLVNPFATTITAGATSNLLYDGASGLNVSGTNIVKLNNAPLGIDLFFSGSTTTSGVAGGAGIKIQTSIDGGTTFSQMPLWFVISPGGVTNIYGRTNFSQAVLGNCNAIRIGQITNGCATTLTVTNLKVGYFY